jgi:hypothetical protein
VILAYFAQHINKTAVAISSAAKYVARRRGRPVVTNTHFQQLLRRYQVGFDGVWQELARRETRSGKSSQVSTRLGVRGQHLEW